MEKYRENRTMKLVVAGILIGLQIVLTRITAIEFTQYFRLSFSFIALAINGALLGPVTAGLSSVTADLIGYLLKPTGPYIPGFTLTAGLSGVFYGLFLYGRKPTPGNIMKATVPITFVNNYLLNSIWLTMVYGIPYGVQLKVRLPAEIGMFITKTIILVIVLPRLLRRIRQG